MKGFRSLCVEWVGAEWEYLRRKDNKYTYMDSGHIQVPNDVDCRFFVQFSPLKSLRQCIFFRVNSAPSIFYQSSPEVTESVIQCCPSRQGVWHCVVWGDAVFTLRRLGRRGVSFLVDADLHFMSTRKTQPETPCLLGRHCMKLSVTPGNAS